MKATSPAIILSSLSLFSLSIAEATSDCPLLGPVFSPALHPASSKAVQSAIDAFSSILEDALSSGRVDNETTSFSISVFSAADNTTLFTKHFSAPGLNGSLTSGELNDDTIYRIGSVSKLLTVYTLLAKNGDVDFNQPITKYIPELRNATYENEIDTPRWCDVTIGALASHLAGISRDYSLYDLDLLGNLGLPPINASDVPICGVVPQNQGISPCTRAQNLAAVSVQRPLTSTFNTPTYSNNAFALLGYVVEAVTNQTFDEAVQTLLYNPLNMTRSSINVPDDTNSIKPYGAASQWSQSIGDAATAAAGGIYSTTADFTRLGRSILRSELLSPPLTRRWLKPHSRTSDPKTTIGAPWEIIRFDTPTGPRSNFTRGVDIYTKSGDIGLYSALLALDVDHAFGFSVMAAGNTTSHVRNALGSLIVETFVPALEAAAREEVNATYSGSYAVQAEGFNASLTLSTDDRPGLNLELEIAGTDYRQVIAALNSPAYANGSIRLYPAGLQSGQRRKMTAVFDPVFPADSPVGALESQCVSWAVVEGSHYGGVGLDEFEVTLGEDGKVESVSVLAFRKRLGRVE